MMVVLFFLPHPSSFTRYIWYSGLQSGLLISWLMKRVLHFICSPKLANILVFICRFLHELTFLQLQMCGCFRCLNLILLCCSQHLNLSVPPCPYCTSCTRVLYVLGYFMYQGTLCTRVLYVPGYFMNQGTLCTTRVLCVPNGYFMYQGTLCTRVLYVPGYFMYQGTLCTMVL